MTSSISILESLSAIITSIFLLVVISYYMLFFLKPKQGKITRTFSSITIIIPAHNEERYIKECIKSVIEADFNGKKQIIVVDDGSKDNTVSIASGFKQVKLIKTRHSGKAASLNKALSLAKGQLVAIVDGDSIIGKNSLMESSKIVGRENTVAACCVVKVKNRKKFINMWAHIEQLYNSLIRLLFSRINANITTPGPLSVYRRKELVEVGGFSTEGFSEDQDIAIRLFRKGYKIGFAEKAIAETNMPYDTKGFLRQRTRFARGLLNILKRHFKFNKTIIDIYTLPIFLFTYIQAVIMGLFTLYQIASGYIIYFFSKGILFNISVLKFFFEWFSIVGFIKWAYSVLSGITPFNFIAAVGIISTLLTYPIYFFTIFKFDKKFDLWHLIPVFFMFPFWLLIMLIYILSLPEMLRKKQYNIWKKNE